MKQSTHPALASLTLAISGLFLSTAHAAEPRVFAQTALMTDLKDTSGNPCEYGDPSGSEMKHWKLRMHETTFKIHTKLNKMHFVDLLWRWPHELQNPDLYVINADQPPIPTDICKETPGGLENYLFLFAIHDIWNAESKSRSKSPHAVMYIPIRKNASLPAGLGDEFYLLIFKIESDITKCPAASDASGHDRCEALNRLLVASQKDLPDAEFIAAARKETRYIMPSTYHSIHFGVHNGVIHGTLGGG